jgi:hypothetical protein
MAVKTDGNGRRWVELDVVSTATPEQAWRAVSTGAGFSAWLTRATPR